MLKAVETIRAGLLKRLHVNQHVIRDNKKLGCNDPPLTCKLSDRNVKASQIDIMGPDGVVVASLVYNPDDPLSCGARVWISSHAEVVIYRDVPIPQYAS